MKAPKYLLIASITVLIAGLLSTLNREPADYIETSQEPNSIEQAAVTSKQEATQKIATQPNTGSVVMTATDASNASAKRPRKEADGGKTLISPQLRQRMIRTLITPELVRQPSSELIQALYEMGISLIDFDNGHPNHTLRRVYYGEGSQMGVDFVKVAYDLDKSGSETFAYAHFGMTPGDGLAEATLADLTGHVRSLKASPMPSDEDAVKLWNFPEDNLTVWTRAFSEDSPSFMPEFPSTHFVGIEVQME